MLGAAAAPDAALEAKPTPRAALEPIITRLLMPWFFVEPDVPVEPTDPPES